MQLLFAGLEDDNYRDVSYDTDKQITGGHDQREIRQCWVVSDAASHADLPRGADWAKLNSMVKLLTIRITPQKTEATVCYFISSWTASAQVFLKRIREHWQIENGLRWVLDVAFD